MSFSTFNSHRAGAGRFREVVADQTQAAFYAAIDEKQRMYNRRVCFMPDGVEVPGHPCIGANRVLDFDGYFKVSEIFSYIAEAGLQVVTVEFKDIWYQIHYAGERERGTSPNDRRFREADIAFPGILAEIRNPDNKRYRMLDGRRRLWKQENTGAKEGRFVVIPVPEVYQFFWMVLPLSALRRRLQSMPQS